MTISHACLHFPEQPIKQSFPMDTILHTPRVSCGVDILLLSPNHKRTLSSRGAQPCKYDLKFHDHVLTPCFLHNDIILINYFHFLSLWQRTSMVSDSASGLESAIEFCVWEYGIWSRIFLPHCPCEIQVTHVVLKYQNKSMTSLISRSMHLVLSISDTVE